MFLFHTGILNYGLTLVNHLLLPFDFEVSKKSTTFYSFEID